MISEAIKRRGTFNVIHLPTMLKIDVFVMETTDFARANMARRVALEIHTRPLAVHPKMIHTHDSTFFVRMTCARLHEGFASVDQ